MKRVRVAPGKFVAISNELAKKAARVSAIGLTRDQVRALEAIEPRGATGVIVGSTKPLVISQATTRAGVRAEPETAAAPAPKGTAEKPKEQ